jgi:hypothetical protein
MLLMLQPGYSVIETSGMIDKKGKSQLSVAIPQSLSREKMPATIYIG